MHQLATVTGDVGSGYTATLTVPIDTATEPTSGSAPDGGGAADGGAGGGEPPSGGDGGPGEPPSDTATTG